jgi:catechol 2,3-dioxygenase-like lactoylglutathione lyase family enzyme
MIITVDEAKQAAHGLRASLAAQGIAVTHSAALEHVAHAAGHRDWNTMAAHLARTARPRAGAPAGAQHPPAAVQLARAIPVLRIFDEDKAREFYVDYLGFTVDWEHRFSPDLPLYLQVSRSGLVLHLSEHHGDGTPGSVIFCEVSGIESFHAELTAKRYRYYRPGLSREPDVVEFSVEDGFGNGLRFCERI